MKGTVEANAPASVRPSSRRDIAGPAAAAASPSGGESLQAFGNQAIQRMAAGGALMALGACDCEETTCSRCASKTQYRVASSPETSDPLEREADDAATALLHGRSFQVAGAFRPGAQRKPDGDHAAAADPAAPSGGSPIPSGIRASMEQRLGADLTSVRVHVGGDADASARTNRALAYTRGEDVVVRSDQWAPATPEGFHLLAHEVAHVVQQRQGATADGAPQRRPDGTAGGDSAGKVLFNAQVLGATPGLDKAAAGTLDQIVAAVPIYEAIKAHGKLAASVAHDEQDLTYHEAVNKSASELKPGETLPGGTVAGPEVLDPLRDRIKKNTAEAGDQQQDIDQSLKAGNLDEATVIRLVESDFPTLWVARAKQVAAARLKLSRDQILAEQKRYPQNASSTDTDALQQADARIADAKAKRDQATQDRTDAESAVAAEKVTRAGMEEKRRAVAEEGSLPGGTAPSAEDWKTSDASFQALQDDLAKKEAAVATAETTYMDTLHAAEHEHPILHAAGYGVGMFQGKDHDAIAHMTGAWTDDILKNIAKTEANIADDTIKVWDLNDVPAQTYQSLAVTEQSVLGDAVKKFVADKRSEKSALDIALTVLEVTLVIGATILNPVAGAAVAVALSSGHLVADVMRANREEAAGKTHLIPELADISANDPDYLAIAMDIVGLGLDVAQLGSALKAMRGAAAALRATGEIDNFRRAAQTALGEAAGETLAQRALRRLRLSGVVDRLAEAKQWVTSVIRAPASVLADLSELAINRLKALPGWVLEKLSQLSEVALRRVLGCASPCKVDLEAIVKFFKELEEGGAKRGATLANATDVLAALPKELNPATIATKLGKHDGLMAAIKEAGLSAEDFTKISAFLTPADLANPKTAYETFTRYLSYAAAARIGDDPKRLMTVLKAMADAQARGASSAMRGSIFESWARMNIKQFEGAAFERLTAQVGAHRVTADRFVRTTGEIWDMKMYQALTGSVDVRQAERYASLIGKTVDGAEVKSINYLFPTKEIAEANRAALGKLPVKTFYLGEGGALVPLP